MARVIRKPKCQTMTKKNPKRHPAAKTMTLSLTTCYRKSISNQTARKKMKMRTKMTTCLRGYT